MEWSAVTTILAALSSVSAVVPMLAFLAIVWFLDRYDREPLWLVAVTFLWGATGAVALGMLGSVIAITGLDLVAPSAVPFAGAVVVAPLFEEPAKALVLLAVLQTRHFDNMTDGFVYGAAAGLGFGMTENFLYFSQIAADGHVALLVQTIVIRTLFSAVMHAMATSVAGAALGAARFRGPLVLAAAAAAGLVGAIAVHAVWNGLLTAEGLLEANGRLFAADLAILPLELLGLVVVFELCLWDEARTIRRELGDEVRRGTLPSSHPKILASWIRRIGSAWVPRGVDHDRYVRATTQLAMRRKQARLARGPARDYYEQEVDRLRRRARALLEAADA